MNFKIQLLQGSLIKRYKRFFADINYKNKTLTCHCPNSGSMKGLLEVGNKVWFSKSDNPKRKLKYTLELIETNKIMVGINTLLTNKIVLEALNQKKIKSLVKFDKIKSEAKYSDNTRFDFLLSNKKEKCFVEVKNVTLSRKKKLAEFPDAITSRGTKHLNELMQAKKEGYSVFMIYLIQREDCKLFKIANDIDEDYYFAFKEAIKAGVKILCYDCKMSSKKIILNKPISYEF